LICHSDLGASVGPTVVANSIGVGAAKEANHQLRSSAADSSPPSALNLQTGTKESKSKMTYLS